MAIRTITTTVDPLNGQTINTINGLLAADTIIGTVLRKNMCIGAFKYTSQTFSLTVPDGSQNSYTIPNTGAAGLPPANTTLLPGTVTMVANGENWAEGVEFTIGGTGNRVITFTNAYTGSNKVTTITFDYYDSNATNLSYDTKVFPDNCRATANLDGYDIILWNNGLQSQEVKAGVTAGTVNAVVEALITDQ
tara:strand:- start:13 stop:588 length:576 start_codon:yes stop_codon:yes gene_type:complete